MEIVLIRHGKPKIVKPKMISAAEFGNWVRDYEYCGIDTAYLPDHRAIEKAQLCAFTVCSTARRSTESAQALGVETPDLVSHQFRECEMPFAHWRHPKMTASMWSLLFRLLQRVGYSAHAESHENIINRATKCADELVELAAKHSTVLFVGHGMLNWFLHKQLLRTGWSGPQITVRNYWEYGVYSRISTQVL